METRGTGAGQTKTPILSGYGAEGLCYKEDACPSSNRSPMSARVVGRTSLERLAQAIRGTPGVRLLDHSADAVAQPLRLHAGRRRCRGQGRYAGALCRRARDDRPASTSRRASTPRRRRCRAVRSDSGSHDGPSASRWRREVGRGGGAPASRCRCILYEDAAETPGRGGTWRTSGAASSRDWPRSWPRREWAPDYRARTAPRPSAGASVDRRADAARRATTSTWRPTGSTWRGTSRRPSGTVSGGLRFVKATRPQARANGGIVQVSFYEAAAPVKLVDRSRVPFVLRCRAHRSTQPAAPHLRRAPSAFYACSTWRPSSPAHDEKRGVRHHLRDDPRGGQGTDRAHHAVWWLRLSAQGPYAAATPGTA